MRRVVIKLYHYDHCPYCVKARMIFGLKNISLELHALQNDDEETPIRLIGKKEVPILILENGSPLPESLDIIRYVDELGGTPAIKVWQSHEALKVWLQDARNFTYPLAMPRWIRMGLPEFETAGAVAYFEKKKTLSIGDFKVRMAETESLKKGAENHLLKLDQFQLKGEFIFGDLSIDDFHLFATLRCLSTTKGLKFPPNVSKYCDFLEKISKVPFHWDRALS